MLIWLQDTKRPDKEPFPVSERGYAKLQSDFPNRYVKIERPLVVKDSSFKAPDVIVIPKVTRPAQGTPAPAKQERKGKNTAR